MHVSRSPTPVEVAGCVCCPGAPVEGVLCGSCAAAIEGPAGLLRDHIRSRAERPARAWLIDAFGRPHAVAAGTTRLGRDASNHVAIANGTVSRVHAEVVEVDGGWMVRDLGSRNGVAVDHRTVAGRATLGERHQLRFGQVGFWFLGRAVALPQVRFDDLETTHGSRRPDSYLLRHGDAELWVVADGHDAALAGIVLQRHGRAGTWSEVVLARLEFHLLYVLCARARDQGSDAPHPRPYVPTRELVKTLPFQSRFANEENVRQVVRRLRASLDQAAARDVVAAVQGRGYYVAWSVLAQRAGP